MTWVMVYVPGKANNDICEYQNGCWAGPPPRKPNYRKTAKRWVHGAVFLLRLVI